MIPVIGAVPLVGFAASSAPAVTPIVWDAASKASLFTTASGDTQAINNSSSSVGAIRSNGGKTTGKWYAEIDCTSISGSAFAIGICEQSGFNNSFYITNASSKQSGLSTNTAYYKTGSSQSFTGLSWPPGTGAIVQIALDVDNGKLWIGKNNTYDGNPSAGTGNPLGSLAAATYVVCISVISDAANTFTLRQTLNYAAPTGFSRWGQ